jgi:chlorite dismutase
MSTANGPFYTMWNVFGAVPVRPVFDETSIGGLSSVIESAIEEGVTVRGIYDVPGLRAGCDVMVWLHGDDPARLQAVARSLRRQPAFFGAVPVRNSLGVHRDAEFTRSHVPAFAHGIAPAAWVTVYPFNRSYEWYLLPEDERRDLLAEHGRAEAAFRSVLTNTVAAFGLGDYEWVLPLEADDLVELVDLMRALRATQARLHVRDEIPFFTGRRIKSDELPELLSA